MTEVQRKWNKGFLILGLIFFGLALPFDIIMYQRLWVLADLIMVGVFVLLLRNLPWSE